MYCFMDETDVTFFSKQVFQHFLDHLHDGLDCVGLM